MAGENQNGAGGFVIPEADRSTDRRPKVVILGAGYAGAQCAKTIQKKLGNQVDLVVVERRKANVHKVASARAAVLGDTYSDRVLIPNDNLIEPGMGRIIHEAITAVNTANVQLASGVVLNYDYLVCATGSLNFSITEPPLRYADRASMKKFYDKVSKKIKGAERILIVGGGSVGCELAGEIRYEYHNKVVTIVHSGQRLLSSAKPPPSKKFFRRVEQRLTEAGVQVRYGQKVIINWREHGNKPYISGEAEYQTDRGNKIMADLVLLCAGKRITNGFYPPEWIDELSGQVKVKRSLQLVNHSHIFAIGDLNDIPENKQAVFASAQGVIAAENICKQIANKRKMKKYSPGFGSKRTFMLVTVGRKKGASYMGFFTWGSGFTSRMKGKNLGVKEQWKVYNMGDQVPVEIGGPSKGNKLGTVKKLPNLMVGEGKIYNNRTRSIEQRHESMGSVTSLADMYKDDIRDSMLQIKEDEPDDTPRNTGVGMAPVTGLAPPRNDVVSFVGSKAGRGESVNYQSPAMGSPAFMQPVSPLEYEKGRKATIDRSQKGPKKATQAKGTFAQVSTEKKKDDGGW